MRELKYYNVGLSMMCYKKRERRKDLFREKPVQGTHGEIVVISVPDSKLFLEIGKGKESVRNIEIFVILAVAAFHFAVVSGSKRFDRLMDNNIRDRDAGRRPSRTLGRQGSPAGAGDQFARSRPPADRAQIGDGTYRKDISGNRQGLCRNDKKMNGCCTSDNKCGILSA